MGFFFLGFFQDKELLAKAKLEFKHVWPGWIVDEQHTAPTSSTRQTSLQVSVPAGARRLPDTPVRKLPRLKMKWLDSELDKICLVHVTVLK